jgi:hypothetical protein
MKLLLLVATGAIALGAVGVAVRYSTRSDSANPAKPTAAPEPELTDPFLLSVVDSDAEVARTPTEGADSPVEAKEEHPPLVAIPEPPVYYPTDVELKELPWMKEVDHKDAERDILGLVFLGWPFTEDELKAIAAEFKWQYEATGNVIEKDKTAIDRTVGSVAMLARLDDGRWKTLFENYRRDERLAEILNVPVTWVTEQRARLCPPLIATAGG